MARYIDDTTTQEFATWQDFEQENQRQWFEEDFSEAHMCAMFPAATEYFRASHMLEDIPF
jgi:hypothetical protein